MNGESTVLDTLLPAENTTVTRHTQSLLHRTLTVLGQKGNRQISKEIYVITPNSDQNPECLCWGDASTIFGNVNSIPMIGCLNKTGLQNSGDL